MFFYAFVIKILKCLSFILFTMSIVDIVVLIINLFKVQNFIEFLSCFITDCLTILQICGQVYQKIAYCTC